MSATEKGYFKRWRGGVQGHSQFHSGEVAWLAKPHASLFSLGLKTVLGEMHTPPQNRFTCPE